MTQIITCPTAQTVKHNTLKDSYAFVSTANVIDIMKSKGWNVASTSAANVRNVGKLGFQRHLVRFEHPDFTDIKGLSNDNRSRPQLVMMNSHDGSTAVRLFLGLIRIACLNGVIAGTAFREFRAVHSGKTLEEKLSEGLEFMAGGMPDLQSAVTELQGKTFSKEAYAYFCEEMAKLRLENVNKITKVDFSSVAMVRRDEDKAQDAFTSFNRVQEALIRGGIRYQATVEQKDPATGLVVSEQIVNRTTRKINSINQSLKLNRAAFDLALKLAA